MSIVSEALVEIQEFVESFKADSFFNHPKADKNFQPAYKQLHSVLIWSLLIEGGEFPEDKFGIHPKEAVSDLAHSFGLTAFSLYKPARVMLRSGIENVIRMIVANSGGDYKVSLVHSLFDGANEASKDDVASKKIIGNLRSIYRELCLTVHSAHDEHLALRIPFEQAFSYNENQYLLTVSFLLRATSSVNQVFFSYFSDMLHKLEHKNRDFVLDSLPRSLKRAVLA